jgi:hypothetical protein
MMRRIINAEQHKEKKASATVGMSGIISGRQLMRWPRRYRVW